VVGGTVGRVVRLGANFLLVGTWGTGPAEREPLPQAERATTAPTSQAERRFMIAKG